MIRRRQNARRNRTVVALLLLLVLPVGGCGKPDPAGAPESRVVTFMLLSPRVEMQLPPKLVGIFEKIIAEPSPPFLKQTDRVMPSGAFMHKGKTYYWSGIGIYLEENGLEYHWHSEFISRLFKEWRKLSDMESTDAYPRAFKAMIDRLENDPTLTAEECDRPRHYAQWDFTHMRGEKPLAEDAALATDPCYIHFAHRYMVRKISFESRTICNSDIYYGPALIRCEITIDKHNKNNPGETEITVSLRTAFRQLAFPDNKLVVEILDAKRRPLTQTMIPKRFEPFDDTGCTRIKGKLFGDFLADNPAELQANVRHLRATWTSKFQDAVFSPSRSLWIGTKKSVPVHFYLNKPIQRRKDYR